MNVDTGCVFGGQLSALRYPENEVVSVPALQTYYEAIRPNGNRDRHLPGKAHGLPGYRSGRPGRRCHRAQEGLLRSQYAATAANNTLAQIRQAYERLSARDVETDPELRHTIIRRSNAAQLFRDAYRNYCWEVKSIENIELAPFHVMASQGRVHADRDHRWHMSVARRLQAPTRACSSPPTTARWT